MSPTPNFEKRFVDAIIHDDEMVAVMRTHLYMEAQLNQIIEGLISYPNEIKNTRLGWGQRVDLVCALGLKKQYSTPLKKIGNIRNKFAHQPEAKLEKKWIDDLFNSLDIEDQEIAKEGFVMLVNENPEREEKSFEELGFKDKFVLIVTHVHAMLIAANYEAQKKNI